MTHVLAFVWVLGLDLALSLDNAAAIALVTKDMKPEERDVATWGGIGFAVLFRVIAACFAAYLLRYALVSVIGGLYLLHLTAKLTCERLGIEYSLLAWLGWRSPKPSTATTLREAMISIALVDLSMSVDNVVAVAGVARNSPLVMTFGLAFSIVAMFLATTAVRKLFERWPWIVWAALALLGLTGLRLIFDGLTAHT